MKNNFDDNELKKALNPGEEYGKDTTMFAIALTTARRYEDEFQEAKQPRAFEEFLDRLSLTQAQKSAIYYHQASKIAEKHGNLERAIELHKKARVLQAVGDNNFY